LQPVLPGHPQIEQKHIRRKLSTELASLFAVGSLGYDLYIFLRFKDCGETFPNNRMIVRNQNTNDLR
jgi:hypothetical protein